MVKLFPLTTALSPRQKRLSSDTRLERATMPPHVPKLKAADSGSDLVVRVSSTGTQKMLQL